MQVLRTLLTNCFQEASNNKAKSLAIPPIGIGKLDFDAQFVASVMRDELLKFSHRNPQTTLRHVRFLVFQTDDRVIRVSTCLQWTQSSQISTNCQCDASHCRRKKGRCNSVEHMERAKHVNESRVEKHMQLLHCEKYSTKAETFFEKDMSLQHLN